ncbi:MAG: conserved membrane protein of unknown function [Candidatus Thorarchaeota archaeon]|nr:MAG: conserved membrane protein of unknown function [Candidatus Thorarchaeota archaeon]
MVNLNKVETQPILMEMLEYVIIVLAVALFGLQHSGLSALSVKTRIIDRWGKTGYSRLYTISAGITLLLAFLSMQFWDWFYFLYSPVNIFTFIIGLVLIVIGMIIAYIATGVISVSTVADMRTDRKAELVTDGIYSRIRHPLYLATILLFLGLALLYFPYLEVLVFSFAMIGYTLIGAYLEERKLVIHYGQDYEQYRKQAGFILPK